MPALLPPLGADAQHPQRTMLSIAAKPTHPHQTLIQPSAPAEPPKLLPQLANAVVWPEEQRAPLAIPTKSAMLARPYRKPWDAVLRTVRA